jgi:GT2 family glycosyltransferase
MAPRLSVVIPLYGRLDFLRYQLAMFSRGGLEGDEIVYVLDEPSKKDVLLALCHATFGSFGIPFRVVLPAENRGFGPVSNLGMRHARGRYICFLNSDVFPERSDFFDLLVERLATEPDIGIVGGLLLFADGSMQHAGMDFERVPELGGWLFPTHPGKGRLPPRDLPDVIEASAITGACMVIARDLALELGGFDPDYLIGDFEDADLCRRIARKGLRCVVDTRARAHHLERQSQGNSADHVRRNVTLVNAWIFNTSLDDGGGIGPIGHAEATGA